MFTAIDATSRCRRAARSHVNELVAGRTQTDGQLFFEGRTGVIGTDSETHGVPRLIVPVVARDICESRHTGEPFRAESVQHE